MIETINRKIEIFGNTLGNIEFVGDEYSINLLKLNDNNVGLKALNILRYENMGESDNYYVLVGDKYDSINWNKYRKSFITNYVLEGTKLIFMESNKEHIGLFNLLLTVNNKNKDITINEIQQLFNIEGSSGDLRISISTPVYNGIPIANLEIHKAKTMRINNIELCELAYKEIGYYTTEIIEIKEVSGNRLGKRKYIIRIKMDSEINNKNIDLSIEMDTNYIKINWSIESLNNLYYSIKERIVGSK